jgi:CHAT domain-containing protein
VIGDYSDDPKVKNLPFALQEGEELSEQFTATSMKATDAGVELLLNPPAAGAPRATLPDAVHFAAHGQVSLDQQQYTGILLAGGRRLDILRVEGSTLGERTRPLIFLNACQVGTASTMLSTYGGLAGSFLGKGCRGFIAPLWNVDDDIAKGIAVDFYRRTLREGLTVGEALRLIRAGFDPAGAKSATPLAYVFYGHPHLRMRDARAPDAGQPPPDHLAGQQPRQRPP